MRSWMNQKIEGKIKVENINRLYSEFHNKRLGIHCYPNEFLVRTMLGQYPNLKLSHEYQGKNVLDWACGDGRNLPLLHNLDMNLYAFEITDEICDGVRDRMTRFGIDVDIRKGRNNHVPYEDEMFDYVVASSSLYYVDHDTSFIDNYKELKRIITRGGVSYSDISTSGNVYFERCDTIKRWALPDNG